jgi:hypothetical protein
MERGWETMVARVRSYAPDFVTDHYQRSKAVYLRYLARRSVRLKSDPTQGMKFLARSVSSDWRVLFDQPGRSWPTVLAVCLRFFVSEKSH